MAACRLRFLALALPLAVVACASGCVQRRMMIVTDPPGALAYVDGYEIGVTPISASFTYYGSREIRLVKDGYETLTVLQPVQFPWYECFPLDFVSENLVPGQIHDQHVFSYKLRPQMVAPTEQLMLRAEALRRRPPSGPPGTAAPGLGTRINPPPTGPPPASAAPAIGGQPVYPLPGAN